MTPKFVEIRNKIDTLEFDRKHPITICGPGKQQQNYNESDALNRIVVFFDECFLDGPLLFPCTILK